MRAAVLLVMGLVLALLIAGPSFVTGAANDKLPFPEVPRITKEQLKEMLGKPDLVIIDARPMEQWKYSDQMIPGTVYEDPLAIQSWAHKYDKNRKIVVY
jgi:3-mercaptopyruvate sulfurtransferase SseA